MPEPKVGDVSEPKVGDASEPKLGDAPELRVGDSIDLIISKPLEHSKPPSEEKRRWDAEESYKTRR